jgi:cis-3-alkyl-4-acyloxetan-2-one decarboxylase
MAPGVEDLYPFESRYLQLRCGHRLHYVDEGATGGKTLLLLHGNPTWSFYYRNLILGLRHRYRCIAPDHIGCGLSDKPQRWSYRIPAHVDNVCELLTSLDLHEVTLVAHDWGGPIGYLAATRFPERFKRFVTFNTAVSLLSLPRVLTMLRLPLFGPLVIRGLNGLLRAGLLTSAAHGHALDREVRARYLAPYDSWANRIAILRFLQEIPVEDGHPNRVLLAELDRNLPSLSARPHLVIWGLKDPIFDRAYLAAWQRRFPGAEVHAFDDAAHWVVEEATERVLPLMRTFLSRTE